MRYRPSCRIESPVTLRALSDDCLRIEAGQNGRNKMWRLTYRASDTIEGGRAVLVGVLRRTPTRSRASNTRETNFIFHSRKEIIGQVTTDVETISAKGLRETCCKRRYCVRPASHISYGKHKI